MYAHKPRKHADWYCGYCGETDCGEIYRREKADGICVRYHLDCYDNARREGQLLAQLIGAADATEAA